MGFVSPGLLYIRKKKKINDYKDILAYAEFLRAEAVINNVLPVDIDKIFEHFEIPSPKLVPLSQQQGLLINADIGLIAINSNDSEKRQKFTMAHELVEILFAALVQEKDLGGGWRIEIPGGYREHAKEFLCNWTAANLLMPPDYVQGQISAIGENFKCAKQIADTCDVSLSAALVQLARNSSNRYFVVVWRMKNKPTELRNTPSTNQLSMFGVENVLPEKKLRVEWCMRGINSPFIPKHKSTESTSLVSQAWNTNTFTSGQERMSFDNRSSSLYYSENMPFTVDGETHVISLMRKC